MLICYLGLYTEVGLCCKICYLLSAVTITDRANLLKVFWYEISNHDTAENRIPGSSQITLESAQVYVCI